MSTSVFDQMLSRYPTGTKDDLHNAIIEVMQQIVLAGLYRGNFFHKAAFYGGTCLRIFYGLQRFSEDLDFSLLQPDAHFNLERYFDAIIEEFRALGRDVTINKKSKTGETTVESAFLKDNTQIFNLQFSTEKRIKIKIEVDIQPPTDFSTEYKLLLLPFSFMTRCYSPSDLYAGKMHALLFRKWKNRVKGRDWYDFEYFVRNNTPLNLQHLSRKAEQINGINPKEFSREVFKKILKKRIESVNMEMVKTDVRPFLKNPQEMEIWSKDYFLQLIEMIQFSK